MLITQQEWLSLFIVWMAVGLIISFLLFLSIPVHTKKKKWWHASKFKKTSFTYDSKGVPLKNHVMWQKIWENAKVRRYKDKLEFRFDMIPSNPINLDKINLLELHKQHKIVNKSKSVSFGTIRSRKNRGWSGEKIVNTPKVLPKQKSSYRKKK